MPAQINAVFASTDDVIISTHELAGDATYTLVYCEGLIDLNLLYQSLLPNLSQVVNQSKRQKGVHLDRYFEPLPISLQGNYMKTLEENVFLGSVVVYIEESHSLHSISIPKINNRNVQESNMEVSIRGPRDGFIESAIDNVSLIRKRLKTSTLKVKTYSIGQRSHTQVKLLYMDDVIEPKLLTDIDNRLKNIDISIVSSSYQIEELLYDNTYSLVPLVEYSGRPDFVVDAINEGRFAIIIDGNPSALIGPTNFSLLIRSAEDTQSSFFYVNAERLIRITALITSILLPGFWLAITSYQIDQIPFPLVATVAQSRVGLPLSSPLEIFLMLLFFELFKEAGIRLPKPVGQTVAVLGGLIVGDAAIRAGLTSPATLVVGAITLISTYTLTDQSLAGNILIIRFFIVGLAALLGLYGFFIGVFLLLIYIASLTSFGFPFVSPLNRMKNINDSVFRLPVKKDRTRSVAYYPTDPKK
ncbi:spore germination protein [Geomicrobium sp. JCM 19038]|uniref:spore germination protein n=1 Tax=Geomicrobium sp. JCM 19038 TaxID=1460635 RepID=UPI00045F402F|nr:spore germination protein [Geomicrobium sp. JCM 19038]GAK07731.1 spore germination protein GerKA [Geomicrobium sp. JCM 19038]